MEKTIPIIYNGGAYGTYLEWCLTTLTTDIDIVSPQTADGSSHKFLGKYVQGIEGWKQYVKNGNPSTFVRLHPKLKKEESITDNLKNILATVEKMVYLYPDKNSVLLNVNNVFYKISKEWWPKSGHSSHGETVRNEFIEHANKIYQNWPVSKEVPFDDIPTWIKREYLSLYLMPMWMDQVEWFHPEHWQNNKCSIVFIGDLLNNFENTIHSIGKFLNLNFKKTIDQLIPFHDEMLKNQVNLEQDVLCNQIIDSVIQNIEFDWKGRYLPLPSEAWLQWQLRNLGFEMQCDGLDNLPTDSINLRKLLYKL
jgi:hypothetical protein